MPQLALVFIGNDGITYVGIFEEDGDIKEFVPFHSDRPFEGITKDQLAICEYGESDVSDFTLNMVAQIQLYLREKEPGEQPNAQAFIEDTEKGPDAYKIIYQSALKEIGQEEEETEAPWFQLGDKPTVH